MTPDALEELVTQCVAQALENYEANRNIKNGIDNGNGNGNGNDNENGNDNGNGNGNGNSNGNGDGNGNGNCNGVNGNVRGIVQVARECTYKEFLNCQPLNFKGTERAVGLARWFEKMKSVFHIRNYSIRCQVKYATCTLLDGALTWWNCYKRTVRVDAAAMMLLVIPNISKSWPSYAQKLFQMRKRRPRANSLMDQKVRSIATRDADNKRKWEDEQEGNHHQQQNKRQEVGWVYVAGTGNKTGNAKFYHSTTSASFFSTVHVLLYVETARRYYPGLENQNGDEEARQNLDLVTGVPYSLGYYPAKEETETSTSQDERIRLETYSSVSEEEKKLIDAEEEAVHIILTGIDNDIYSTVDACPNAKEKWKAIERLMQGVNINKQDVETNLFWAFGKFTSRDAESLESYYSRFYKLMNKLVRNKCEVSNLQVDV
ncbi:hypothetical protein Tco_0272620 [Tanacetum coccineum]